MGVQLCDCCIEVFSTVLHFAIEWVAFLHSCSFVYYLCRTLKCGVEGTLGDDVGTEQSYRRSNESFLIIASW